MVQISKFLTCQRYAFFVQQNITHYNTLQYTAPHCNTPLQCVAVNSPTSVLSFFCSVECNTLQHTTTHHCSVLQCAEFPDISAVFLLCKTIKHTATHHCSVLQCVAMSVCCSVLQCLKFSDISATFLSYVRIEHTATHHCSVLQFVAAHMSEN